MTVRVKICGITRAEDVECAIAAGADIIGFNFHPPSPRYIDPDRACELRAIVKNRCAVAGVFVNASRSFIQQQLDTLRLDFIQFHGDETDADRQGWQIKVIRALRLNPGPVQGPLPSGSADYLLIDTFHPGLFGGTGQARSFDGLGERDLSRVFLSGGLNPDNVGAAARLRPYCVDVASGVESSPGIKDHAKLRSFIINAKSA